jgi:hypothetical protein
MYLLLICSYLLYVHSFYLPFISSFSCDVSFSITVVWMFICQYVMFMLVAFWVEVVKHLHLSGHHHIT